MNDPQRDRLGLGLTLVMAFACGVTVANIYYNQPLLGILQAAFPAAGAVAGARRAAAGGAGSAVTGFVATATQLGYAAGLILLVPLGDRFDRRHVILIQSAGLALSLAAVALAPNAAALVAASLIVGIFSSVAQQIVPFAAELAQPSRRGATIGIVMSGLLCGILFGRALAGTIGGHFGWRAVFWFGTLLTIATGLLLAATLPHSVPTTRSSYGALMTSLATLWREEPALRRAAMIQACLFASFSALWTILALQLAARYHQSAQVAGLFGVVGAVGVLFAPLAGKIADRKGPYTVIGIAAGVMLASWLAFGAWGSMAGLIAGVIFLDFGQQGALVSNQHVIYALRPEARNRLNTVFMGGMFIGGAIGSAGANLAWALGGWGAVCALGGGFVITACALHVRGRRAS